MCGIAFSGRGTANSHAREHQGGCNRAAADPLQNHIHAAIMRMNA